MAKTTGAVKHTHQYFRRYDKMWACSGVEGCTHYMPKNMSPLPVGLQTRCWGPSCKNEFMLTPVDMENDRPMCEECTEKMEMIGRVLDTQNIPDRPTGLAAFGAKTPIKEFNPRKIKEEIEIIEEDE